VAFLNVAADLAAGTGAALYAGPGGQDGRIRVFSSVSYGQSRYETGSHVDVSGVTAILGASFAAEVPFGRIAAGLFVETGDGGYDSYNDFPGSIHVKGAGTVGYFGGGVIVRADFSPSADGNFYAELSARAGKADVNFSSPDLPQEFRYDFRSSYHGFHLGFGRLITLGDSAVLDLYAKWLYTRQAGSERALAGESFRLDAVSSSRLKVGGRLSFRPGASFRPYFGLAYEREFSGRAGAGLSGYAIPAPELRGGTGSGELGFTFFAAGGAFALDAGVTGYAGVRKGVSGSLTLKYIF
jgi:hypothetical protein